MLTESILAETIAGIQRTLRADIDRIAIERAVIGLFFTGVKLDTGTAGACAMLVRKTRTLASCAA